MLIDLYADTKRQLLVFGDFTIQESRDGWEWTHKDYASNGVTGTCQTIFEALSSADNWSAEHGPTISAAINGGAS